MNTYCTIINILYIVLSVVYLLYFVDSILSMRKSNRTSAWICFFISAVTIFIGMCCISTNWYLVPPTRVIDIIFVLVCYLPSIIFNIPNIYFEFPLFVKVLSFLFIGMFGLFLFGFTIQEEKTYDKMMYNDEMYRYKLVAVGHNKDKNRAYVHYMDNNYECMNYLWRDDYILTKSVKNVPPEDLGDNGLIIEILNNEEPCIKTINQLKSGKIIHTRHVLYLRKENIEFLKNECNLKIRY